MWGLIQKYAGKPDDTFKERIARYHGLSQNFTVNILLTVAAYYILDINAYVAGREGFLGKLEGFREFLSGSYLPFILALCTLIWYSIYRSAVRNEMEILFELFSQINPPRNWQETTGLSQVPVLAVAIPATFLALAASVKLVPVYCLIMLGLNILDIRGNSVLRQMMTQMFLDPSLAPPKDDPAGDFVARRRAVAEEYWIARPQIERIGLMMIANGLALVLSSGGLDKLLGFEVWPGIPIAIVIGAIAVNEVVIHRWRWARDAKLAMIKADFDRFTNERALSASRSP